MGVVVLNLDLIMAVLAIIAEIIACAAWTYMLDCHPWTKMKIYAGTPASRSPKYAIWNKQWNNYSNYFITYLEVFFAIISYAMLAVEIGLIFHFDYLYLLSPRYIRGAIYIFKGVCCLGVVGDLGIAAGSIEIAFGIIFIILFLVLRARA